MAKCCKCGDACDGSTYTRLPSKGGKPICDDCAHEQYMERSADCDFTESDERAAFNDKLDMFRREH